MSSLSALSRRLEKLQESTLGRRVSVPAKVILVEQSLTDEAREAWIEAELERRKATCTPYVKFIVLPEKDKIA